MKKIVLVASAAVLAFGLFALVGCGKDDEGEAGMPNPMTEVDADGLVEATGIALVAPEGATDVQYFTIDLADGSKIGEMRFTLDGVEYAQRAKMTDLTEFPMDIISAGKASMDGEELTYVTELSGMYYTWDSGTMQQVSYCDAQCFTNKKDKAGVIMWIDVVPGIIYSVSATDGATTEGLTAAANAAFVPMQGDA